tara:strand:+ start:500 stop:1018 length:519 start_codon:yes stop_codon:yes gene_type:complete
MLNLEQTKEFLEEFKNKVIRESKSNLSKKRKRVTKKLYESIDGEVKVSQNSFQMSFFMEEYGLYQDKGVSGTEKKYNTPYSYRDKIPPAKPFIEWARFRKLQPRLKSGKFGSYKTMGYILARSVYKKGIKPSLFFTKPFEKYFKKLPNELVEKFGLDVEDLLAFSLDEKRLR